jgi:hypothetical protein
MSPILGNVSFARGILCGMLLVLAAFGLHWFNSPSSEGASALRAAAVTGQVVICGLWAVWLFAREKRSARAALPSPAQTR